MESGKVVRWNELLAMNMMDGGHGEWNEKDWKWVKREHYWWNGWYEKWLSGCWKMIFSSGYFSGITGLMILSLVPAPRSFTSDGLITLDRDENSVHTKKNHGAIFIVILNSDLSLTILSKAGVELGSKNIIPSIFTKFQVKQPTKHSTNIGATTKTIARSNNED